MLKYYSGSDARMKQNYKWLVCPNCNNQKIMKVRDDTTAENLIVFCKRCKCENLIDIKREPSAEQ